MIPVNTSVVSGVAIADIDGEPKILLLKRSKEGFWCHVAGKIEEGETGWQAIIREFHEETGIKVTSLYNAEYSEQFYESGKNRFMIIPSFVVFCEQNQAVTLNHEHTEYRWCSLQEAIERVPFPNQKHLYQHVWQYFIENRPSEMMKIDLVA
ncbi:NUDIX hydrolase [Endozoicomonas arenosclerae]|uniref:NUDIX hydrolase n=1 Tax=Endozoicomonas arenosclerae TaxID=1633495 RepID=UPI000781E65E|nr:NUDIX domain-containing protein [Endozoicomonas arenosclerae]